MVGKRTSYLGFILWVSVALTSLNVSELAELLVEARKENQPIPILSDRYPGLGVKTAYDVQRAYVRRRLENDKVAGFKAGLTSEETQKKFGVDFPVSGVLFASGERTNGPVIDLSKFKMLMIETEIGFVVGSPIAHPIKGVSELRNSIQAVVPVIELPDLGFADMKKLQAVDIIAANVSAAQFTTGEEREVEGLNLNDVTVMLSSDGERINRGKGSDALGDQWKAALWLVNKVVEQGWKIEPGQIIITGVLGKMIPGKPGKYVADYGSLGKISFEVR